MKNVFWFVCLIIMFVYVYSCFSLSKSSEHANNVRVVAEFVEKFSIIETRELRSIGEFKRAMISFCSDISRINLNGCSSDFCNDFNNIKDAALQLKYVMMEMPESVNDIFIRYPGDVLNGEIDETIDGMREDFEQAFDDLNRAVRPVLERYLD